MDTQLEKQRKIKVLYVITKSNFGGAQRYVYDLATSATRNNLDVVVALGGTGMRGAQTGSLQTKLLDANIRTIPITHFMRDVSVIDDVRAFVELIQIVRNERPDVLHVTSSKAGGLGALAGRIVGVPRVIFTSHGLVFDESWRPRWQRMLLYLFTWCTMLLAHTTIQISRDTYQRARTMPCMSTRVHHIYNGITAPEYLTRDDARKTISPNTQSDIWIGTIAELHPNKNLSLIIEALALLRARDLVAHVWLIGEGEERERLTAQAHVLGISEYVHFSGYVDQAARVLSAFDIFVLPSKKEGLPYVLLEAGYTGIAVIGSDISGINEIVTHKESGILIPDDAHALADALETLIRNADIRMTYGATLATRVREQFSSERMFRDTYALYSST